MRIAYIPGLLTRPGQILECRAIALKDDCLMQLGRLSQIWLCWKMSGRQTWKLKVGV